ncbi:MULTISPECIES: 16S rRNA (guanine(966)-N(2))-methyltransferase RsmD [Atopobiaceae]|jgi:16S rRNA (guanine966-N2)-methyltransferase|uniref:16S rRNA (Guanine(966)-N(2))-methyltransferase RsmD n=1 Tax=Tractidigestivibacter montrealensis TaxID=2972466 RepID=A0ABT1Z7H5_9ACTN|nr:MULTISPECIES: 16S rRNA (guanine(966)-N(2))-methyltransferase RsmD [Atopobiaceae]MCR9036159.1 16S rRNA (guanine(966)-N(2))-methyltransferase RsmD [Tractidigestivibacter montrealensis]RGS51611.1 16S rRNA (guanine(966)-N(2))-methyltransferase RsmD [Olsenella sp. AF21-51]RHB55866.1 16S rRNA (guanine(966)-N(2))-methyltransferase RsmD [Olsenella sp. AM39-30AC]RHK03597.1 16S rRNA (guanine(966)-N(2))-methyltransferase RsmD [Olsenella sp. AM04-33]
MRVVGGKWGGVPLESPEGRGVTRPTTDRNREAMASMILSARGLNLGGASVLDAFAGSGAMGIELLSRGADRCTFIDQDARAATRVRRNLAKVGAEKVAYAVLRGDACQLAERGRIAGAPFDVVFLDPPYALSADVVSAMLEHLAAHGALRPGATVVYERSAEAPGLGVPGLIPVRTKRYGITCVDLLEKGQDVD